MPVAPDPSRWLLPWSSERYPGVPANEGRPWGDGTAMAARQSASSTNRIAWDPGCRVTPLIGGYETLCSMRDTLEDAIALAPKLPADKRGHVYIADWRLDPLRDLSDRNPWRTTRAWTVNDLAQRDQTAAGLILRMMQAGIRVRVMVWYPVTISHKAGMSAHIEAHLYLAKLVEAQCQRLAAPDRGIVALDLRVAAPKTATHHQKTIVIRVGSINVAYVGGVDWAHTRRDAPDATRTYTYDPTGPNDPSKPVPQFLGGDWQSGAGMPALFNDAADRTHRWPKQVMPDAAPVDYTAVSTVSVYEPGGSDLPVAAYGTANQIWHDQHLRLEGPIVQTLEDQYRERWVDSGVTHSIGGWGGSHWTDNQVIFSTDRAYSGDTVLPLEPAAPEPPVSGGNAVVQMWRTIPLRKRAHPPFTRGEYTIMAGISNACTKAQELVWIFDQYFFSRPLGRLLNAMIKRPGSRLNVIVVLPPYADDHQLDEHRARKLAMEDLTRDLKTATPGVFDRVAICNLWDHQRNLGIYCHTKVQLYDQELMVCGSANLNRRSLTCDTELDCAVNDPAMVVTHQQRLWKMLFPGVAWPAGIAFGTPGWGAQFLQEFRSHVTATSFLEPDPFWDRRYTITDASQVVMHGDGTEENRRIARVTVTPPKLLNNVSREQEFAEDFLVEARTALNAPTLAANAIRLTGQTESESILLPMEELVEPSSLTRDVERVTGSGGPGDPGAAGRLDEVVYLIEGCVDGQQRFPWRHA
jgi:phosphatidylserine/phosphatidylglycerophosphate/cardiolipin synthase-like enzyme